jgi:hypothetical protein
MLPLSSKVTVGRVPAQPVWCASPTAARKSRLHRNHTTSFTRQSPSHSNSNNNPADFKAWTHVGHLSDLSPLATVPPGLHVLTVQHELELWLQGRGRRCTSIRARAMPQGTWTYICGSLRALVSLLIRRSRLPGQQHC